MLEVGLLLLGLLLGGLVAWTFAAGRGETAARAAREGLQSRLAASESRSDELAKQISQRDLETGDVRRALDLERQARTQAETRLAAEREGIAEQRALLEEARRSSTHAFKALSADALRDSHTSFLTLADERLGSARASHRRAGGSSEGRAAAGGDQSQQLESRREGAYATLEQQLSTLRSSSEDLRRETLNLVTALRGSQVRGRWGELTLRRVVGAGRPRRTLRLRRAGDAEGERQRPAPGHGRRTCRASARSWSTPRSRWSAYLDALDAPRPEERNAALCATPRRCAST